MHFEDIRKLLQILHRLVDNDYRAHLEVMKTADWIIDIGPEGGEAGGRLVAQGTPEHLTTVPESYTGLYLKKSLPNCTL